MASPYAGRDFIEIQAAVARGGGDLNIETVRLEKPRDDEILVRIVATGICHTDIGMGGDGVILGHEGAGVVVETGKSVKSVKPDDHVALSYAYCGRCSACLSGTPWQCDHYGEANFGFSRIDGSSAYRDVRGHFFGQSSFATYSVALETNAVKVPPDLNLELFGPLGCGIQTGAGTVMNTLLVPNGASIVVLGTGAVGLSAVMAARIVGADPIIGVDINPMRLDLALDLGATHTIDSRTEDVAAAVSRITGGGVDYTVDTTANGRIHTLAVEMLNPGGAAAYMLPGYDNNRLSKGRRTVSVIEGSSFPQKFIPELIDLWRQGRFPFDRLIKMYDFADINRAIADTKRGDAIKPVLRIGKP